MRASQIRLQNALRRLQQRKVDVPEETWGKMGTILDGTKTVTVPNRKDYVYVRLRNDDNEVVMAYCQNVLRAYGIDIELVYDRSKGIYIVKGRMFNATTDFGGEAYIGNHGWQHSLGFVTGSVGTDPVWVYKRQFMPMLVQATSPASMQVKVNQDIYPWGNTYTWFPGATSADLTGAIPAYFGDAYFVTLYIDGATNDLAYITGSTFSLASYSNDPTALITMPPAGSGVPAAAVLMYGGMTHIPTENIYDIRQIVSPNGGMSGAEFLPQTANTVFAGPTTGAAAAPTFRSLVAADITGLSSTYIRHSDVTPYPTAYLTDRTETGTYAGANRWATSWDSPDPFTLTFMATGSHSTPGETSWAAEWVIDHEAQNISHWLKSIGRVSYAAWSEMSDPGVGRDANVPWTWSSTLGVLVRYGDGTPYAAIISGDQSYSIGSSSPSGTYSSTDNIAYWDDFDFPAGTYISIIIIFYVTWHEWVGPGSPVDVCPIIHVQGGGPNLSTANLGLSKNPYAASVGGSPLTVRESDGSPSVSNVTEIIVSNGTLVNNGGGTVTVTTGGGGGGGGGSSVASKIYAAKTFT